MLFRPLELCRVAKQGRGLSLLEAKKVLGGSSTSQAFLGKREIRCDGIDLARCRLRGDGM